MRDTLHALRQVPRLTDRFDALQREVSALREPVESIRVHTWHAKEAALIAARDGVLAASPRYADPRSLVRASAQAYSQNAEDGMIAEVFRRIGTTDRVFLEVGVGDGRQNNTRLLLETGWRGVWVESDPAACAAIRGGFGQALGEGRLRLIETPATRENAPELVAALGTDAPIDFLSVDIDRNTGHVWQALGEAGLACRVACVEYNASIPPSVEWQVPYDPDAVWDGATHRFGAGLKALERLGRAQGLSLVGCDYLGNNAFFVADGLLGDHFLPPFTAEHHYEPPRYTLLSHRGHPPERPPEARRS
ncbi:MAG: hypothetical protein AAF710_01645 [Planctomycetota bacterium]